ncbi:MAG: hypothetical protein EBQ92_08605 [Proteobacteria bacterium]|nr:hypothetical protein [Pseudomonadota bacterium]
MSFRRVEATHTLLRQTKASPIAHKELLPGGYVLDRLDVHHALMQGVHRVHSAYANVAVHKRADTHARGQVMELGPRNGGRHAPKLEQVLTVLITHTRVSHIYVHSLVHSDHISGAEPHRGKHATAEVGDGADTEKLPAQGTVLHRVRVGLLAMQEAPRPQPSAHTLALALVAVGTHGATGLDTGGDPQPPRHQLSHAVAGHTATLLRGLPSSARQAAPVAVDVLVQRPTRRVERVHPGAQRAPEAASPAREVDGGACGLANHFSALRCTFAPLCGPSPGRPQFAKTFAVGAHAVELRQDAHTMK